MVAAAEESLVGSIYRMLKGLSVLKFVHLLFTFIFVRWLLRGIYRAYFHPLSHFPGPKFAAFTRIPHLYASATGSVHRYIARLHEEYGDVVRISPDELSFNDPQAWRDIYGYGPKAGQGTPPPKNLERYAKSVNGHPSLVIVEDNEEHARVRRIFSPAFSDRALMQQAPLFSKYVDTLIKVLQDGIKSNNGAYKLDIVKMYNFTTFDIMSDLSFGESLHMLETQQYDEWVAMVFRSIKIGQRLNILNIYYPLASIIIKALSKTLFSKEEHLHFSHSATRVTKRLEKGRASEGVDIWDLVLSQEEKGKEGLSRGQMDANSSLFMIAGTETTASLLSGLTYLLLVNPTSMEKLVKEVRSSFASSSEITMDSIAKLPFLNACIKEGLRRYPPLPVGLPHVTPSDGSTICGHFVPPGTTVAAHHMPMYSSPKVFKDPLSFIPERWTGDPRYADDERSAVQPFSVGSRDCLGKNMAYYEMRLILSKVIYNFDFELCPESNDWTDQDSYVLWEKHPLMVKVRATSTLNSTFT